MVLIFIRLERECRKRFVLSLLLPVLLISSPAFAAHPLLTDDTGTQGLGHLQVEANGSYSRFDREGTRTDVLGLNPLILSYGVAENYDLVVTIPYLFIWTKESGKSSEVDGLSDITAELKWRFYEKSGFSAAVKPGISLPTGDDDKGLGAGRLGYRLFLIATEKLEGLAFHLSLGYLRNENELGRKLDLWHTSLALQKELGKKLTLVANTGMDRNPEGGVPPAFILGGVIYRVMEGLDMDAGVKAGLNRSAEGYSILFGLTKKF